MNQAQDLLLIEKALNEFLPEESNLLQKSLFEGMRYSLLSGGKRIRPRLVLEFCRLCGGKEEEALPFACAVEMIHSYSLIHDDLPCMDDDDMRRGRASNHAVYGEAMALLAGDGLLTRAFEIMLSPNTIQLVGAQKAARAAGYMAEAAGSYGMVGGQAVDLLFEGESVSADILEKLNAGKTGALIVAACRMGCVIGGASEEQLRAAETYAHKIGLAFQIRDDLLDISGNAEKMGKNIGMDSKNGKTTYANLLGERNAQKLVHSLTDEAVEALNVFCGNTNSLTDFAYSLAKRDH